MRFIKYTLIHWTTFGTYDISLGIHLCWRGRIDFHILHGMISIGRVPLYLINGKVKAVSNSFHHDKTTPIRSGTP